MICPEQIVDDDESSQSQTKNLQEEVMEDIVDCTSSSSSSSSSSRSSKKVSLESLNDWKAYQNDSCDDNESISWRETDPVLKKQRNDITSWIERKIMSLLSQSHRDVYRNDIPYVARKVEITMYLAAKTRKEYLDVTTLAMRMRVLIKLFGARLSAKKSVQKVLNQLKNPELAKKSMEEIQGLEGIMTSMNL